MCDKSIKAEIYSLFEKGLSANEVIEKLNLYEYKSVVNGCYSYYNRMNNNSEKNELEIENDNSFLNCERLRISVRNFAEAGRELIDVLKTLNCDYDKKYYDNKIDTYTFLRQFLLHEIENEHTEDVNLLRIISQTRRSYKKINEAYKKFGKNERNNLNNLVVMAEKLADYFSVNHNNGTELYVRNRLNNKENYTEMIDIIETVKELINTKS
jgi:ABC-type lipoprotein release transport system permease subunit